VQLSLIDNSCPYSEFFYESSSIARCVCSIVAQGHFVLAFRKILLLLTLKKGKVVGLRLIGTIIENAFNLLEALTK
jgi:hypothetical protein